jgi:predicted DNA-binding transcriptional regulator AlpA
MKLLSTGAEVASRKILQPGRWCGVELLLVASQGRVVPNEGFKIVASQHVWEQRQMAQTDELISARDVADLMGVALDTVYTMRHYGRGPVSYRRGKRLVYSRREVEDFLTREREATLRGGAL